MNLGDRSKAGLCLALLTPLAANAQQTRSLPVDTHPSSVTVYLSQANVTRTGEVDIPEGDSVLLVTGVSQQIIIDTVTAKAQSRGNVTIGSVDVRPHAVGPAPSNAGIEQQIADIDVELRKVEVRSASYAAERDLIRNLAGTTRAPTATPSASAPLSDNPQQWKPALEAIREGTFDAAEGLRQADQDRRTLEKQKNTLQSQLQAGPRGSNLPLGLDVAVSVHADQATTLALSLSYQVPGPSWRPVYDVRLDTGSDTIALVQEAIVSQQTGEDWQDVTLALSTARPASGVQMPELSPWRVRLATDPQRRTGSTFRDEAAPAPAAAPAPVAQKLADFRNGLTPLADATVATASFDTGGTTVEYKIAGSTRIPANGTERRVRLTEMSFPSTLTARAIPKLEPRAYLRARFTSRSSVALMPGRASLTLDSVYIGQTSLPLVRPGEEVALPFGPDEQIRVVYEPQVNQQSREGNLVVGRKSVVTRSANMTIKNFHVRPMEITVVDQTPLSGSEELVVDMAADPAPTARDMDDKPGIVGWTYTYRPQEERKIHFGFTVTAPDGRDVAGLGR